MNAYSYANNNPVSNTDPTGLWSIASAWSSVKSYASAAVATVKSYTNTVVTGIKSAGASASSLVSSAATYVSGKVNTAVSKTTTAISNGYASMGNTLTNVGSYIAGTSAGIYNQVIASPINLGLNAVSQGAELVRNTPTNIQIPVVQPGGDSSFNSGLTTGNVIGIIGALVYGGEAKVGSEAMIHGNSLKSLKPTWFYKLYDESGNLLKNGITNKLDPAKRYAESFMENKQMVAELYANRAEAYMREYLENLIERGPLNKNMH